MFNLKSGEFLRGSGSSYDPSKRKQRSFSFPMSGRETVTILQETALLLEPSDVTRFAEHFIDWLEKYNITGILDTHVVKVVWVLIWQNTDRCVIVPNVVTCASEGVEIQST